MSLKPGQLLTRYRIIEEIGQGGMGTVYLAEDIDLHRRIALKVLPSEMASDPERLMQFKQEARAIAAVSHPNIVIIHSVEEDKDLHYLTMELVKGKTLTELIGEDGIAIAKIFDIAIPLVEAVGSAHQQGVAHRDLKPANIMVTDEGAVKILDFGLAKLIEKAPGTTPDTLVTKSLLSGDHIIGTPDYMSPEQAKGKPVDHRTDIFSTGILLYEMVTGEKPFKGDTTTELLASIIKDTPRPLNELNPACPLKLSELIELCIVKDPDKRYQSFTDIRRDLEKIKTSMDNGDELSMQSIAVLPFADMSPNRDQGYFCEGIAEEIINALVKIKNLRVASRMSAFQYTSVGGDSREIGKQLGVKTLLEGSVRKAGNQLRISAQLINAANGYHVWSERFDREMSDIFAIQDEIAQNIVSTLQVTLNTREKRSLVNVRTSNVQAYDFYLRGRNFFRRWGKRNIEIALRMFTQAIEIDPEFGSAHAGIADTYSYLYMYINSNQENLQKANEFSLRALELDPTLAEANASRGLALSLSRRYEDAEAEFELAIEKDPNLFEAYYFYARNSIVQGKYDMAVRYYNKASEVNPDDYQIPVLLAQVLTSLGRKEEGEAANRKGFELAEKAFKLNPEDARAYYMGAGALVRLGQQEKGLEWANRAMAIDPDDPAILYNVACVFTSVNKIENAIDCLEKTVKIGASYKDWMLNDSDLDPLRDHPRFKALLESLS